MIFLLFDFLKTNEFFFNSFLSINSHISDIVLYSISKSLSIFLLLSILLTIFNLSFINNFFSFSLKITTYFMIYSLIRDNIFKALSLMSFLYIFKVKVSKTDIKSLFNE